MSFAEAVVELPLWASLSIAAGFGGAFALGCVGVLFILQAIPPLERVLDRFIGGDVDDA